MKRPIYILAMIVAVSLTTVAYAQGDNVQEATAVLKDTNGTEVGYANFTEDDIGRVHVDVKVKGLSPGQHGIHIHEVGKCSPNFTAAGQHYNPLGKEHGLLNPKGPHAGDLPNIEINDGGMGYLNVTTGLFTLSPGPTTLFDDDGSAIVIHSGPDDQVTDPAGASGDRIACGVIERK